MKHIVVLACALLSLYSNSALAKDGGKTDVQTILRKADDIRNPAESYFIKVDVVQGDDKQTFDVFIKGRDKALITTLYPPKEKDRKILMVGESMWVSLPTIKRPVRVSLSQKLTGEAANGDICRMRWSGDYNGTIEEESPDSWQLLLKANKQGLTYDQLRVWIQKKTYRPLKAEFLSLAGKVLKRAEYTDYKKLEGRDRPSTTKIVSAIGEREPTFIKFVEMQKRNFPNALFDQTRLK